MTDTAQIFGAPSLDPRGTNPPSAPCIMLIFGASGDLTKRLLVPALYDLACDGLLSDNFAVLGTARRPLTTETYRAQMSSDDQGIRRFHTRKTFDEAAWNKLNGRLHYIPSKLDDVADFRALREHVARLDAEYQADGNILFYFATSPSLFGMLCDNLHAAGFKEGDAMLFSRGALVEAAWKIAQPILDYWSPTPAPEFPHYTRGTWGPRTASALIERDGRHWFEVVTTEMLERLPLFNGADALLLNSVIMALRPVTAPAGEIILRKGDLTQEMYLICHGEVEVLDGLNQVIQVLDDGNFFGEIGLLVATARTATVRARTPCDLFMLGKADFSRILRDQPQFAGTMMKVARERYSLAVSREQLFV